MIHVDVLSVIVRQHLETLILPHYPLAEASPLMSTYQVLAVVVFAVVMFLGVIVSLRTVEVRKRRRTAALQKLAQEMGFCFCGDRREHIPKAHQISSGLFKKGSPEEFQNFLTGVVAGLELSLFDYSYTINGDEGSSTHTQTVAAFSQKLWLPDFELRPENLLDRIGKAFVDRDIDFDSNPDFCKRYLLRGPSEAGIRKLFSPTVLNFLEQLPADEKWHVEGSLTLLVIYQSKIVVPPEEMHAFLRKTSAIATRFLSSPENLSAPVR